jgi:cell division transport system permease protein
MLLSLKRICKLGWEGLIREKETILPTISVLFIATFLVGSFLVLKKTGEILVEKIKEKADIVIYLKKNTKEEDILKLRDSLLQIPGIKNVKYVSEKEALDEFLSLYGENPLYKESLEIIGENPLLPSLHISSFDIGSYDQILNFLENTEFKDLIDHTSYPKTKLIIERIFSFVSKVEKIGMIIGITFFIIAVFVNFNTIHLAILNSREEIEIQRRVGASNWFIRGPFLFRGFIYGILAGILSFFMLFFCCWFFSNKLYDVLGGINIFSIFKEQWWQILLIQFGIGVLLAEISTFLALQNFLKF